MWNPGLEVDRATSGTEEVTLSESSDTDLNSMPEREIAESLSPEPSVPYVDLVLNPTEDVADISESTQPDIITSDDSTSTLSATNGNRSTPLLERAEEKCDSSPKREKTQRGLTSSPAEIFSLNLNKIRALDDNSASAGFSRDVTLKKLLTQHASNMSFNLDDRPEKYIPENKSVRKRKLSNSTEENETENGRSLVTKRLTDSAPGGVADLPNLSIFNSTQLFSLNPLIKSHNQEMSHKQSKSSQIFYEFDSRTDSGTPNDDNKEDDDDNDEDDDDDLKQSPNNFDPERLKAFNLFVRLFIDENLDRTVPISKQPKEKIQAVLDACDRQFGEFHDRARKRVRTYLKSCRRMKRVREGQTDSSYRPTPPHLTSVMAENILAQACDNEAKNAKRMHAGLEPIYNWSSGNTLSSSSPLNLLGTQVNGNHLDDRMPSSKKDQTIKNLPDFDHFDLLTSKLKYPASSSANMENSINGGSYSSLFQKVCDQKSLNLSALRDRSKNGDYSDYSPVSRLFSQSLSTVHHRSSAYSPLRFDPLYGLDQLQKSVQEHHGPTDLSMKKGGGAKSRSDDSFMCQLSAREIVTVKQLIVSYRESASFLHRSAEELEQLLLNQQKL